ncbi:hypothetical protein WJX84_010991 [Apatococcus fuscideae]|uniref:Uncharacterized protein n=1 Tax=Apatococcus fuscideae TaxID=2026836 RepID=A0AAW1TG24_9CHLO
MIQTLEWTSPDFKQAANVSHIPELKAQSSRCACRVDAITVADEVDELLRGQMLLGGLEDEALLPNAATPGTDYDAHMDDEMIFMQTAEPFTDALLANSSASPGGGGIPMGFSTDRPEPAAQTSPGMDPFLMLDQPEMFEMPEDALNMDLRPHLPQGANAEQLGPPENVFDMPFPNPKADDAAEQGLPSPHPQAEVPPFQN